jgi:hypothetical protein
VSDHDVIRAAEHENAVLRHKFRRERHKNRADIIVNVHDPENCDLCRVLALARLASTGAADETPGQRLARLTQAGVAKTLRKKREALASTGADERLLLTDSEWEDIKFGLVPLGPQSRTILSKLAALRPPAGGRG